MKCIKTFKKSGDTYEKGKEYPQVTQNIVNGLEAYFGEKLFEAKKVEKKKEAKEGKRKK